MKMYAHMKTALMFLTASVSALFLMPATAGQAGNLSGCYDLKSGAISISPAFNGPIGTYNMVLERKMSDDDDDESAAPSSVSVKGPMYGFILEKGPQGAKAKHAFGTDNRIGTLNSGDEQLDVSTVDPSSVSCFNDKGVPQKAVLNEVINFSSGTGIFSGLTSGSLKIHGYFNACNTDNPVADGVMTTGVLCFK